MSAYLGCQLKFELRPLYLTTKLPYEIQNWLELIFNSWKASFMSLKRSIIRQVWYCMGLAWPSLAYLLQNTKAGSKKFPAEPLFEYFLQLADEKKYSKNSAAGNFFLSFLFCDGFNNDKHSNFYTFDALSKWHDLNIRTGENQKLNLKEVIKFSTF